MKSKSTISVEKYFNLLLPYSHNQVSDLNGRMSLVAICTLSIVNYQCCVNIKLMLSQLLLYCVKININFISIVLIMKCISIDIAFNI